MSTSQIISIGAAVLAITGATLLAILGDITWAIALPIDLAGFGVLGIHPNLPTVQ